MNMTINQFIKILEEIQSKISDVRIACSDAESAILKAKIEINKEVRRMNKNLKGG